MFIAMRQRRLRNEAKSRTRAIRRRTTIAGKFSRLGSIEEKNILRRDR
jgi:hypothetical protein